MEPMEGVQSKRDGLECWCVSPFHPLDLVMLRSATSLCDY
jgi:hypothetical protein